MDEVKVQSNKVGPTSYQLTFFGSMSIGPPIFQTQLLKTLTLKIQG